MSPIPVSKAKIIPPRRRDELLTRQRLLDMLFDALDRKLALVSAPAGYGKTSLLIDLVDQSELPCCWLALDELDRDPQRFAAYFIAALAERFPKFGSQSKSALEGMSSFEQDMERLLVTLCNEIYETIHEHFIFVLDDFHLLDGVQPIQYFINRFLQLADENCHLVIASRILTSLNDLPLLVAREQVGGLSFSDLAFQPHELQALLAQNNNLQISDEQAQHLIEETEGWITGLQFSGADVLRKHTAHALVDGGAGLFDYLGQQVLERQPADLQEFILRTALFDEFDSSLCESVLAPFYAEAQDWQDWIKVISRNNLFALPVGADGRWLRYHHLFRDFLRERFKRERPQEVAPVLTRLEAAYEELGEWEKAHHICRQLNDMDLLAAMIERASTPMLQHAILTLESWLNDLPPSMLRRRSGLLSIRGTITYTKGDLKEGLRLLSQAVQICRQENDIHGLNLTLVRRATAYRFLGDYAASLRDAEQVIQSTEASDDMQAMHAEALRIKGLAFHRLGNTRQAVSFLERSLELFQAGDPSGVPILLMETGMAYRAIGDFTQARNAYEKALQIWRQEGNLSWQASLLNNLGVLHQFLGEYSKAAQTFEEGLLCAQRSRYTRLDILISISLGDLYAELEDFSMAGQNFQHASDALQGMDDRFVSHSLKFAQANLAILQADAITARTILESIEKAVLSGDSSYENAFLHLLCGRLCLLEGDAREAVHKLEQAQVDFSEDGRDLEAAVTDVWLAASFNRAGKPEEAAQKIKRVYGGGKQVPHALVVAMHQARKGLEGMQADAGMERTLADLFAQAERLSNRLPAIRRELRRHARVVQTPAPHITIQAFGGAVVSIGGRTLTSSDWQTQSVRDLFFYFLAIPKPMTKEQIGEVLWPDLYDASKLRLRFKNEIYRLRRAVGLEVVAFKDVTYTFNRRLDYEYDVEAFESFLARGKAAQDPQEQIALYQKAVDLVHGPYLQDVYADWVRHDRERLSREFLHALVSLADLYQKNAQPENAIAACRRAIEYDPAHEAAYRLSMQAYSRLGDRASIKRMYEACHEALKRLHNLPPSMEIEELYSRLTR
ncbi:MAG: tetratricopeptide repeat protein [Anaerolineales bacterium]|nr:MAG: tetratricopeptide repeat protein [Anaerolineales bacterium]